MVRLEDGRLDVAAALDIATAKKHGPGGAIGLILKENHMGARFGSNELELLTAVKWRGTRMLTQRPRRLFGDRYLVIGDSAGYVEPFTGEGIGWALASGAAVVPYALESIRPGTASTGPRWTAAHRQVIGQRMRLCRAVSTLLRYPSLVGPVISILERAPRIVSPIMNALNAPFPM
jgi:flavin-dependent dehydrogenase